MNKPEARYQVVIVGGGPVGLFLGICLRQKGISCLILEKRKAPNPYSRSIGIHPVSLKLFDQPGLADCFIRHGIKIKRGHAISNNRILGTISFEDIPEPYNFILSLPQNKTEQILRKYTTCQYPELLIEGAEVQTVNPGHNGVSVHFTYQEREHTIRSDYTVGCDGKNSTIRECAHIPFEGKAYPDTYIMGDFTDNTHFGEDAMVYLHPAGLIECFPLPENKRRWVVKTDKYISRIVRTDIEQRVWQRVNHDLSSQPHFMLSSFGVQKMIARTYVKQRIILAGDAAHVVSPIGGQGMNLGWIDASVLAQTLTQIYSNTKSDALCLLERYSRKQQKVARKVIRQAELNTRLGRKSRVPGLKNILIWLMLNTPVQRKMSRVFTMTNL